MKNLEPMIDAKASYYGKAKIFTAGPHDMLISYGEHVASITHHADGTRQARVFTRVLTPQKRRHTREFLMQNGFDATDLNDYYKED